MAPLLRSPYSQKKTRWDNTTFGFFLRERVKSVVFGLPWIISFHYEPPVGRAQAVTPQVLLKNTRLVSPRAGHSGHFLFWFTRTLFFQDFFVWAFFVGWFEKKICTGNSWMYACVNFWLYASEIAGGTDFDIIYYSRLDLRKNFNPFLCM